MPKHEIIKKKKKKKKILQYKMEKTFKRKKPDTKLSQNE